LRSTTNPRSLSWPFDISEKMTSAEAAGLGVEVEDAPEISEWTEV
jgi:hypothetical protein